MGDDPIQGIFMRPLSEVSRPALKPLLKSPTPRYFMAYPQDFKQFLLSDKKQYRYLKSQELTEILARLKNFS